MYDNLLTHIKFEIRNAEFEMSGAAHGNCKSYKKLIVQNFTILNQVKLSE